MIILLLAQLLFSLLILLITFKISIQNLKIKQILIKLKFHRLILRVAREESFLACYSYYFFLSNLILRPTDRSVCTSLFLPPRRKWTFPTNRERTKIGFHEETRYEVNRDRVRNKIQSRVRFVVVAPALSPDLSNNHQSRVIRNRSVFPAALSPLRVFSTRQPNRDEQSDRAIVPPPLETDLEFSSISNGDKIV